ncbi:MAG: hypothetical protein NC548_06165 [Lachnospiraceae bacterium]|nr:hypothetical protein [Lachnospiraceae bacterium]
MKINQYFIPFSNPAELLKWMKENLRYSEFTTLMSGEEVYRNRHGSCHDQVMLEVEQFKLMGIEPTVWFTMEYNDKGQGGKTHSFITYPGTNKSVIWFENAWESARGIHKFPNSIRMREMVRKNWEKDPKYPNIWISEVETPWKPGMTLQQIVDSSMGG